MSRSPSHARRLGLGAVVVAAGIAAATSPAQAASCTIKGTTPRQLDVQMTANNIVLENINGQIIVGELGKPGFVCAPRSALDKVTVRSANGPGFDQVIVDETRHDPAAEREAEEAGRLVSPSLSRTVAEAKRDIESRIAQMKLKHQTHHKG